MQTKFTRNVIFVFLSFCFVITNNKVHASHLVGADLTYNCLSGNTYEFTLNMYRDCAGGSLGTTASIAIASASCGVSTSVTANLTPGFPIEVSAICPTQISQTTCSGGSLPGIQQWQYKVVYTLPQACTDWTFSYTNCCRNYAISTGPGGNSFYVQATLNNVAAVCNSSPDFTSLPVPYMCLGQLMNYNHGAFDINGDSLVYSLVNPMQSAAGAVTFNAPYNATYPLATNPANNFAFNTLTGQMTFVPAQIQQGVCAVRVREYRNGVLIGTVVRDIQMVVINCTNNANVSVSPISNLQNATVIGTNNIRVCAGELLSFNLTAQDPNAGTVISMVSNTTTAIPGSTFTTVGTNPKTGTFTWQTNANSTGYWNFTVTVSDNNCPVPSVQVYGFTINVFGVDIAASDYTYCPGTPQAVQLDASVGGSVGCPGGGQCYSWTPAAGLSATNIPNPIATVSSPTSYVVTYNDGVCIVRDTVTFVPEGSVTISPANPVVCSGSNAQLTATNTFPSNNLACGSGAGVLCNGPSTVKIIGTAATNGATQYTSVTPYNGFWHDSRMQMLFTAAELTTAGTLPGKINSLVFNIANKYSSLSYQGFTIKMGCTNLTALNAAFQPTSVTCYSNTVNTFAGLNTYNFTTPFMWDGVSNVIVEICYNNTAYTLSDPVFYTATAFTSVVYNYGDNNVGCSMTGSLTSTLRPNVRFSNCSVAPPVSYTWTSIAGDPVSTLSATNIANPLASPTQTTTYVVGCDNGSCVVYDTVTVTLNPNISLNNIPDVNACPSATTTLTASGVGITGYSWSTGQGTASINVSPAITTTYTVTATSACGNLTDNVTVFAVDNIAPVITACPSNFNVTNNANACGATVSWTSPNATDNCLLASLSQTTGLASGSLFPIGTTTVTYIATDGIGNKDTCSFTVTVTDTQAPVINNCPANIVVSNSLGVCGATVNWTAPTTTDNCPNATITQTAGLASGATFPLGTSTITYTATDASGNTATCSFTITVNDTEVPVIVACPANIVLTNDIGSCGAIVNWTAPTTTDNCPNPTITQTAGLANGSLFPLGTSTITYTATDANGNTATCTFTITITDTENPVIVNCPANIVMTNDISSCGAVVNWIAPTTTDNCPNPTITQTAGLASGSLFPLGTSTITYTATDASGNTATCTFTITITDTENPVIVACPANISQNNDLGICGAAVTWTAPTTTDNCPNPVIAQTVGLPSGSVFPLGTSTITYTATDASGNTATCTFTITITDTENPVIVNCPTNIAQNNDLGQCGAIVNWTDPTTTDNCPNPTITQTAGLASGSLFPLGTSTITYTATDANGNTATCSFTITITDTENPVILNCPANIVTVSDAGACGAIINWIAPSFTDNCAGASLSQTQGLVSGSLFPLGTSTIQYVVTDAVGLTDTCTFTITISDSEAPQIVACPANIVMTNDIGSCGAVINWIAPTTTDNCAASIVQTQGLPSGSLFPLGTSTIEYIATDASGNTDTCTFTITITDTENPVIVACPANIAQNNDLGICGAVVSWAAPTTTDNCPNPVIVQTAGLTSGSIFPLGTSTIEYIATDASGNQDTCTFTITITDTELPVIVACPANIAQNNDLGQCGAIVTWTAPTTTDNCPNPTITQTAGLASGSLFPLGTSTITYIATDANGNSETCTFTITITDTENPVLSNCPANIVTVGDAGACGAIINWIAPSFTDNCAGASLSQTQGLVSGSLFPLGTSTIQYVVTDAVGLTDTCTFTITITDSEAPQIVACPANIVMTNDIGSCGAVVNWAAPTTTDNCSASIVQTQGLASGSLFPLGTSTIEYIATDASGNTDTCTFTITITDTENPVIVACPANISQNNDLGICGAAVTWAAPTTTDNCPNPVIVQTAGLASGSIFPLGTSTIEYIATDASGNQDTCTFTITITDTELPVIVNCPANIAQNNDLGQCGAIVNWTDPTTTDNCPNPTITQTAGLASGSLFPLGTSTITYTATDANGNSATCTFTITITDTENPVLSNCPANIVTVSDAGTCGAIVNWTAPSFTDNCAGASLSQTQGLASGSLFPLGTSTIQYVVTDAVGLTDTCTFTISISDTEAPVITHCPADVTLSNDLGVCGAVVTWANVTFTDNCSATIAQTQGLPSGSLFPLGQSTIQYVVTDASGNRDTCTFFLKITDDEDPIISNCPANFTLNNAPGVCGAVVTWTQPTVSDNCPNPVMAQTAGLPSGFTFPIGTTYVEYSAVDAAGNTDTCSFTITITDNENPVITNCPANITKGNDLGQCGAIVTWTAPTVTDNCPNATITQTAGLTSGSFFALGTSTITYIATDAHGNKDTCSFTVTVSDTENPVIANCPANILHSVGPNCDHTVTWTFPTVSDNCPGVTMSPNHNSGDSFPFGATTVTYIATDAVGLKDTCTFTITVVDDTPPVINNCPSNMVLNLVARCDTIVNWTVPSVTDNCPNPTMTTNHQPNTVFTIGTTTVTYIATDAAGLKDTCTFTVTVNPPPALNASLVQLVNPNCFGQKGTATVSATGGSGVYTYTWSSNPLQFGTTAQLANGNYIVTIKDALAGACVGLDTLHIQIIQPSQLTLSLAKTNPTCFGFANGDATSTVGGGTPGYTYTWNTIPVQSTATASNLTAGTYSLEVNDANGCTISKTITLTQPDSLQGIVSQQNVKCFGDATGSANIQVSKGTPPYQFVWTGTPSTTGAASGLVAGTYTVTVMDAKGCTINRTFVISQPAQALSATVSPKDADCFGTKTGSAVVNALGGTPAYTYTWNVNPVQFGINAVNLAAGNYTMTTRDANNCAVSVPFSIGQPPRLDIKIVNITHAYCDSLNGQAEVIATGGASPYQYQWNSTPPQTGVNLVNVGEGNYHAVVTDAGGCKDSVIATLNNTPPAQAAFTSMPTNDGEIVLNQANILFNNQSQGAVAYMWAFGDGFSSNNTNPSHIYQDAGTYTVTLTAFNAYYVCPTTYSLTYIVIPNGTIFVPNAFSPNNDGSNDLFQFMGEGIKNLDAQIYNRWGVLVYTLKSPSDTWNGKTLDGQEVPEGAYTYKANIELNDGSRLQRGGTVMVIR